MYSCSWRTLSKPLVFTIFSCLLIIFSANADRNGDGRRLRRILHQPFFPVDGSPPTSPEDHISQPPLTAPSPEPLTQQPKYPSSTLPPPFTTEQHPFFTFFPSSPPPPPPSTVPTFPANISSVVIPSSSGYHRKPVKLISIIVSVSLLSTLAFASLLLLLLRSRSQQLQYPNTDDRRLFPHNAVPSDSTSTVDASKKPPPSIFPRHTTPSSTSSEFLYLGTLVSSRDPNHTVAPVKKTSTAASVSISTSYQRLDSPDLQPLPPLPRHYSHNTVNPSDGEGNRLKEDEDNTFSNGVCNDFFKSSSLNSLAGNSPAYSVTPADSPSVLLNSGSSRSVQSKSPDSLVCFPAPLLRFIPAPPAKEPRVFLSFSPSSTDGGGTLDLSSRASNFSGDGKLPPPPPPQPLPRFWEVNLPNGPPEIVPISRKVNDDEGISRNSGIGTVEIIKPKLKPLHWDKVKATSDKAMVWDQMKSDSSFQLDEEMIQTLFTVNAKDGASRQKTPERNHDNLVLDSRKSHNIAILLRALNVTVDEVCEALVEGNTDTLGVELLESLLKMAPTEGEELKLRELKGESHFKRGTPEAFLSSILDIPFAFKRVDAMLYIATFEPEIEHLKKSFDTIESACEELKSSRMFLKLLEAVLKTGNRMNVGTNRGDAHAFKLDTLLKLVDVKGADGKTTLLHFVVQEIISAEKSKESTLLDEVELRKVGLQIISGLSGELVNVKKAAAMDFDVFRNEVSKIASGISKITEVLRLSEERMHEKFSKCMNETLKKFRAEIESIQAQEGRVHSMMMGLTEYFHGGSGKEESHQLRIFMIVRDFLCILENVCKDVGKMNDRNMVSLARPLQIHVADSETRTL